MPTQTVLETADDVALPEIAPYVKSVTDPARVTTERGRCRILAETACSTSSARIGWIERAGPENPDPPRTRDTDRLVIVTAGELNADVAAESAVVTAEAVIVIPAGMPHRIWNSLAEPVRYLDVELTAPTAYQRLAPQSTSTPLDPSDQLRDGPVEPAADLVLDQG